MYNYTLHFLSGLSGFVVEELNEKFAGKVKIELVNNGSRVILFKAEVEFIEEFRVLKSAIQIQKDRRTIALDKPLWRSHFVPAGINSSLAWCICKFAELNVESKIIDPFCGAGTLGITAGVDFHVKKVILSDISERAVNRTIENLRELKLLQVRNRMQPVSTQFTSFIADIEKLNFPKEKFSHIISNPPYGLRVGDHKRNIKIYNTLASFAKNNLADGGKIVLISQEKQLVESTFSNWNRIDSFDVKSGGLYLRVWKYGINI